MRIKVQDQELPSHVVNILYFNNFSSHESLQSAGIIGEVTLTVNIPSVAGKITQGS